MSVVKKQGVNADYTEAVVDFVLNKAYAPDYGARPLKRFIQKSVETFIAEQLVRGDIITKIPYTIDIKNDNLSIRAIA